MANILENEIPGDPTIQRRITIYRDDSTTQVIYNDVKTYFWTANNTILTIARYKNPTGSEHYYTHWPRERICWFKDEPME